MVSDITIRVHSEVQSTLKCLGCRISFLQKEATRWAPGEDYSWKREIEFLFLFPFLFFLMCEKTIHEKSTLFCNLLLMRGPGRSSLAFPAKDIDIAMEAGDLDYN